MEAANVTPQATLRSAIKAFAAHERVLVASDFDGVLAPIVLDPSAATAQPGTIAALQEMASHERATVAIVSGRDLATLRRLTGITDDAGVILIGSHGAEWSHPLRAHVGGEVDLLSPAKQQALQAAGEALERIVQEVPSARIERKPAGVVLHTRGLGEKDAQHATELALASAETLPGVEAMRGKSVVELTVLEVSKGAALTALAAQEHATVTAYFGDDVTDETAFAVLPEAAGHLTVKVGDGPTQAAYRISTCTEMPNVLTTLASELHSR